MSPHHSIFTFYEDNFITSLNLRFQKIITTGGFRTHVFMNASNLFNELAIFTRNRFYGGVTVTNDEFFRPVSLSAGRTRVRSAENRGVVIRYVRSEVNHAP